jgi:hypothetical protein
VLSVNLKELIKNYDDNLLNDLRGFGKGNQFLNFWVPSTDYYQSFLNLIDAIYESKIDILDDVQKNPILIDKIDQFLSRISSYKKKNQKNTVEIEIKINLKKYKKSKLKKINFENKERKEIFDKTKQVKTFKSDELIKKEYVKKLNLLNPKNFYKKNFTVTKNSFLEKVKDIEINICISDNIINKLEHNSKEVTNLQKLINIFFELILGKHIHEVAEHGVIYLEEKIRTIDNEISNKGIILPEQAGLFFSLLNNCVRNIFDKYRSKNKLNFEINRNYFEISPIWKMTSEKEKFDKINKVLIKISKNYDSLDNKSILVNKIENHFKIYLKVDENFKNLQKKKNLLLNIETNLKKLDNTLEVFVDEILDQNKLRLKNSPQNI